MNNKLKSCVALLLALTMLLSLGLAGCGTEAPKASEATEATEAPKADFNVEIKNVGDFHVEGTTHIFNVSDTEDFIAKDGVSEYAVVIEKNAAARIQSAAMDFVNFFVEATGVYLPTVYAEDVTYSPASKYIVLGNNAVSQQAGVVPDGEVLGVQGFHIKTVDKSIFALGNGVDGTQFAAFELLTQLFNFDYFGVDCYYLDKNVKEVPLKNYDITDVPDIGIRCDNYMFLKADTTTRDRMRLRNFNDMVIAVGGKAVHNSFCYIHPDDYPDKDKWFSTDGKNLCYTAHGDADQMAEMQQIVASIMIESFKQYPDRSIISMTHEDTRTLCECDACNRMKTHYNGSQAASLVIFLNGVAELVEEYFQSEEGKPHARDFTILFFAYHASNIPPANYDAATDTYTPVDDAVVLSPHLVPYFAETNGDYTKDFYDPESANAEYAHNMRGWAALSDVLYFWMYSTNFMHYLTPYNTFDTTQATYRFAIENDVDLIYDQGQSNQTGSATGWSWLKIYLYSKLAWNIDQDIDALIHKFMENYFGPGAELMEEVFYDWKTFANYQSDMQGYSGPISIYHDVLRPELWERETLLEWTGKMTQAMEALETVKYQDFVRYNVYVKNIATERIAYNYLLMELYQPEMTAETIAVIKEQLYHDQSLANIGLTRERGNKVQDVMINWDIF